MTLVLSRLALVLTLALGLSTAWVAASAWSVPGNPLTTAAYAQDDGDDDDDDNGDDGNDDDDGARDDDGDDDRDDGAPEGGVDTGRGGTSGSGVPSAAAIVPASLAGLAAVGGGLLLWRRRMTES